MNETYRAELSHDIAVVLRIARQPEPWFVDESHLVEQARQGGVPTARVLGLEHRDHDGALLSFSVQQFLPGRSLDQLVSELPTADLDRLVVEAGEVLARVHSLSPDPHRGIRHDLRCLEEHEVTRIADIVAKTLGSQEATLVERGADFLRHEISTRAASPVALVHGDFCPKNILIQDGMIAGFVDWEFAGTARPAYDLAQWEVDAGDPLHDRLDLVRRGYRRVADPESAEAGWTPAFAVDWSLEKLGWRNPASPDQFRHCLAVIAHHTRRT